MNLIKFLKRIFKIDKVYLLSVFFETLMITARTLVMVFIPKLFIDIIQKGKEPLEGLLIALLILFSARLLELAFHRLTTIRKERINVLLQKVFSEQMMSLPYRYLEDPHYLELKEEAQMGFIIGSVERITSALTIIVQKFFVITGLSAVLFTLNPYLFLGLVSLCLITFVIIAKKSALARKTLQAIIPINRKFNVFVQAILDTPFQKDVRLFNLSDILADNIRYYNREMLHDFIKKDERDAIMNSIMSFLSILGSVSVFYYAGRKVIKGAISLGDFSLYTGAVVQFSTAFTEMVTNIFDLKNNIHFIEPIETFLSLKDDQLTQEGIPFKEPFETLEVKNISFRYPGSEEWILRNVSFSIKKGEKVSLVGLNGAGKSTLVKLICRFFPVEEGEILMNGKNIFSYDYDDYMKHVTAIFQDFGILHFSIAENILGSDYQDKEARKKAEEILEEVGFTEKLKKLPQGIDTFIGKAYHEEGVELSGGELQKLAIARALYKNSDFVILDEPTSALDPMAEAEIYENFNELVGNKSAIYISHRMSSSVFCDKIVLLNEGTIEAVDTHQNLMQNTSSLYYKLFKTQQDHYTLKAED
ncbi:ABC transporter ATP-binding protein [Guggenheimella bovis]